MTRLSTVPFIGLLWLFAATPAQAYMGPGIGLGAVSTALSIVAALLLGLVSILWYPAKRLVRRLRSRSQ